LTLIKAVVFDFDGTLFKFVLDYKGMRNAVKESVVTDGVPASLVEEGDRIRDVINKMIAHAKVSQWSNSRVKAIMDKISSIMDRYEWESAKRNTPVDGAREVLVSLREMGLKIGLLTNNSEKSIIYLLKKYKFTDMLDAIVTRNDLGDFNDLKPSPVGLRLLLRKLGVEAEETICVGDSVVDVRAALGVGAEPVFVTAGYSSEKEAREACPNIVIIDRLQDLLTHLTEHKKGS